MNDSTALVTGANKGTGQEIARQLVAAGFTVHVGSRDPERGHRAVDEIGGGARLLVLDVTEPTSIADAARRVEDLDVLVNNAGIMVDGQAPPEADVDSFRRTYETNVFAVLAVTGAAYRSSKTALNALTVFYAQALESEGFRVNALAPGPRRTGRGGRGRRPAGLLPDDGPTGGFFSWDGTPAPW